MTTTPACQESGCFEVSRTMVTGPDDALRIGGRYGDVLAVIVGERSGTISWQQSESFVRDFPPPGDEGLTVEIHPPSEAWDVEIEKRAQRNERLLCPQLLETELEIELRSDDGSLDTTVFVPVTIDSPSSVSIIADLTDEDLGGVQFDPFDQDASLRMMLSYRAEAEATGVLIVSNGSSDEEDNGIGMTAEVATWILE